MQTLPIWNNRELIGHAKNAKSVEKVIRSKLQTIPEGWKVSVKQRSEFMVLDCGLPRGFVYSIHP